MPLLKSPSKNMSSDMDPDKSQALAVAYSTKRRNKKKMAKGGMASADSADTGRDTGMLEGNSDKHEQDIVAMSEPRASADQRMREQGLEMIRKSYAMGGEIDFGTERRADTEDADDMREMDMLDDHSTMHGEDITANDERRANADDESIADAIMRKRRYADGGMVDLDDSSREDKNREDDDSFDAILKEQYDDSQLSSQPMDSNEHGDKLSDADSNDHIEMMRRKIMSQRNRIR